MRSDIQQIAAPSRVQPLRRRERPPQPGDVSLERFRGRSRGRPVVEILDQPVCRDDLPAMEKKDGKQRALPGPAQEDGSSVVVDLEWTQDSKVHWFAATVRYPPAAVRQLPGSILTPVDRNGRSAPEEAAMRLSLHRTIAGLALILTAAATMAGGALASSTPAPDWFERAVNRHVAETQSATIDAHQRAGGTLISASSTAVAPPDWFERAVNRLRAERSSAPLDAHQRGLFAIRSVAIEPALPGVSDDGFAWGDAALGAVAALAIVLLGGAAAMSVRHRKRVALP